MLDLSKLYLFRMTHLKNIPHILEYGITHISSLNHNSNYLPIGDGSLILSRNDFKLDNNKLLGEYIPFYFGFRMPMLYVLQKGFNGVNPTSPENIVYCVSTVKDIIEHDLDFIFRDGHAVNKFTEFFESDRINDVKEIIDIKAIQSKYWKDDNDLDLKRRKESEFLISEDIPISAIKNFIVYNNGSKIALENMGIDAKKIYIYPQAYF